MKKERLTTTEKFKLLFGLICIVLFFVILANLPKSYCKYCGSELKDHNGTYWCPECQRIR